MNISENTLSILKNFSTINNSILIREGNEITAMTPQKNIIAKAGIDESFPVQFGIYDLSRFLGAISLFNEPTFDFGERSVTISESDDSKKIEYFYADEAAVTAAPNKEIKVPDPVVSFDLERDRINELLKAASVLQVPQIAITSDGDGSQTRIEAVNVKNRSSNSFSFNIDHTSDEPFQIVFRTENLKMMSGDYNVAVSFIENKGQKIFLSKFTNDERNMTYYIAAETDSKYNEE